jgi:hypothetical protein
MSGTEFRVIEFICNAIDVVAVLLIISIFIRPAK